MVNKIKKITQMLRRKLKTPEVVFDSWEKNTALFYYGCPSYDTGRCFQCYLGVVEVDVITYSFKIVKTPQCP